MKAQLLKPLPKIEEKKFPAHHFRSQSLLLKTETSGFGTKSESSSKKKLFLFRQSMDAPSEKVLPQVDEKLLIEPPTLADTYERERNVYFN